MCIRDSGGRLRLELLKVLPVLPRHGRELVLLGPVARVLPQHKKHPHQCGDDGAEDQSGEDETGARRPAVHDGEDAAGRGRPARPLRHAPSSVGVTSRTSVPEEQAKRTP